MYTEKSVKISTGTKLKILKSEPDCPMCKTNINVEKYIEVDWMSLNKGPGYDFVCTKCSHRWKV